MIKPEIVKAWCLESIGCPYIYGGTGHGTLPTPFKGRTKGHISFSGHGCPVQFRNVWIRAEE